VVPAISEKAGPMGGGEGREGREAVVPAISGKAGPMGEGKGREGRVGGGTSHLREGRADGGR